MLKVKDLYCSYGNIRALKGVTLEVSENEIVSLIGANGAGKSTLLKAISGLIKPENGRIYFMNEDITELPPVERVRMGICQVPEGRRIFPDLTLLENLEMGAYLRKDSKGIKEDLENIFNRFPILRERKKQHGGTLSGGEQQMLAIGRALMARPKLLLMDEPSLGLAPMLVQTISEIIQQIHKTGTTMLLVEQNANMALHLADRGYVLETGTIVLEDKSSDLIRNQLVREAYLGE